MSSFASRRALVSLAVSCIPLLLAGCPKKDPAPIDAAPPPAPAEDASTVLVPMEEDAGVPDTGTDAPVKYTGPAVNTNVARLKQCCAALAAEAKRMGSSPEAGMFASAAAQCSTMAAQAGPSGTAPELGALRTLLAGRTIPAVCGNF